MFTGIIEELGTVITAGSRLSIRCTRVLEHSQLGSSIAVNGVCLTAVEIRPDGFSADLAPETLRRSNLGDLKPGDRVNLERPMTLATRLSGHLVQGHVDATATLDAITDLPDGNHELTIRVPAELDRYLVFKGSVTIDGISLTVAAIDAGLLRIAIIPHTWTATNLSSRHPGDRLNIECDMLAKHVEKLMRVSPA